MRPGVGAPLRPRLIPVSLNERQCVRLLRLLGTSVEDRRLAHTISIQLDRKTYSRGDA